ncbi:MAG: hypothetical protein K2J13_05310, partial [Clostridia bacterium]|nr:hypothetical protein [Clostridia bacterium]
MLGEIFDNLDITALLSAGIDVTLSSNGNFNVNVGFDPYTINKLIDDIMSLIFTGGRTDGITSLLNLAELAPDMFSKDHLSNVVWDRENKGSNDKSTFWGSLREAILAIVGDVLSNLAGVNLDGLSGAASGVVDNLHKMVIVSILPFAVFNEFNVGLNFVDGTLANVYITGFDKGEDILYGEDVLVYSEDVVYSENVVYSEDVVKDGKIIHKKGDIKHKKGEVIHRKGEVIQNKDYIQHRKGEVIHRKGEVAYSKSKSARSNGYYTQIWVYNMFKAVGDKSTSISGQQQGVVTWTDIPAQIEYEPYNYTDDTAGVKEIYEKYFTQKRASYQDGANGKIIKQDVSFYMKSRGYKDENGNYVPTYEYPSDNNGYLTTKVTEQELAVLSGKGVYVIQARAVFDNPVTMDITINSRGLSDGIESVESFSMHVYDVWPDFITVKMGDGTTREISTERLTFWKVDAEGNVTDEPAGPETYKEHTLKAAVRFPRTGQNDAPVDIVYLDSTVNDVIINGEAIKATDGNVPSLIIDLYDYNLTAESSVMDYVSNRFFFKYKDGKADSLEVNENWQFDETRVNELYDRI